MESEQQAPATDPVALGGSRRWLWLACATYLLLRGAILFTAFDQVALAAYEPYLCGTVARSLFAGGGDLPLAYLYDNAAGPVLMGLPVALCFALFGSSYLALKLVPLALGLCVLVLAWSLLRRFFGTRTANVAAFLIALAPTTMTKYTLVGVGNHSENVFFTLLATWAFFRMHSRGVRAASLAASGLCAGLAFTVFIGALTPIALLALAHLGLRGLRRSLLDAPAALAGFAAGLAPLVWLNLGSGGRGLAFLAAKFGEEGQHATPWVQRFAEFFTVHLPASTTYPGVLGIRGGVADGLFAGVTLLAFLACAPAAFAALLTLARGVLRGNAPRHELLGDCFVACAWLYLPLTSVAYASSNLKIGGYSPPFEAGGYRYFLPHFAYTLTLIAIAHRTWAGSRHALLRRCSMLLAAAPLAAGAFNLALVDFNTSRRNVGAHYEGHNFARIATNMVHVKLALPPERIVAYAESYAAPLRARVYWGLGYSATRLTQLRKKPLDLSQTLAAFPPERHVDVARGIGTALRSQATRVTGVSSVSEPTLHAWIDARAPFAEQVVEGLALEWIFVTSSLTASFLEDEWLLFEAADAKLRPSLARGIGHACGRLLRREIEVDRAAILALLLRLPLQQRQIALEGLGAGLADGEERARIDAFAVAHLSGSDAHAVVAGFARRCREIWIDAPPEADACIDAELPREWHEAWARAQSE